MGSISEDMAAWQWGQDRFEEIFGVRSAGTFVENWPKDKRIAVLLTFDTQGDVDAAATWASHTNAFWPNGAINYCDLTMRQYDIFEGLARVTRILKKHDVRATFLYCGLTADWYPSAIKSVMDEGHEIGVHGYRHIGLCYLTDEQEREEVERATDSVSAVTGLAPMGWRSPRYSTSERTLELLRDFGYQWQSDFHDTDFPYLLTKEGRTIVAIPAGNDDWGMYLMLGSGMPPQMGGTPYGNTDGIFSSVKGEFDVLYEESAEAPRVLQWCMHPKISGRPFRAAVLDRLIAYMKEHEGVWFATCEEVASLGLSAELARG